MTPLSPLLGGLKAIIISDIALLSWDLLWTFALLFLSICPNKQSKACFYPIYTKEMFSFYLTLLDSVKENSGPPAHMNYVLVLDPFTLAPSTCPPLDSNFLWDNSFTLIFMGIFHPVPKCIPAPLRHRITESQTELGVFVSPPP